MFVECRQYLIDKMKEAGLKSAPYTSMKELQQSLESHVGAVLFESESFLRNGSKKIFTTNEGETKKRRKLFDRTLIFSCVLGDYTAEATESLFESFIRVLGNGITIDGNFVLIEIGNCDWVDDADSLLKAKLAAQFQIQFIGGMYRDNNFAPVSHLEVSTAKEEQPHG